MAPLRGNLGRFCPWDTVFGATAGQFRPFLPLGNSLWSLRGAIWGVFAPGEAHSKKSARNLCIGRCRKPLLQVLKHGRTMQQRLPRWLQNWPFTALRGTYGCQRGQEMGRFPRFRCRVDTRSALCARFSVNAERIPRHSTKYFPSAREKGATIKGSHHCEPLTWLVSSVFLPLKKKVN